MLNSKTIRKFLIIAISLLIGWKTLYYLYLLPDGRLDHVLTEWVLEGSVWGLDMLGFESQYADRVIYIKGEPSVAVGDRCNGLELTVLYIGFFLCFPGSIKFKVVYIFLGSITLFALNIIREMALALNYNYFRSSFDINHKYTFALLVYLVVFLLWKNWINAHSFANKKE